MTHFTGNCYCGQLRYEADGDPVMKAQCHCRECQYITGGGPNFFMLLPAASFRYLAGTPHQFTRTDIPNAVTREFCPICGTHVVTRLPSMPMVVLKVGTLDDPALYTGPDMAIYAVDAQAFHAMPDGLPVHDRLPG
jgi:hypothetical protein